MPFSKKMTFSWEVKMSSSESCPWVSFFVDEGDVIKQVPKYSIEYGSSFPERAVKPADLVELFFSHPVDKCDEILSLISFQLDTP